MTVYSHNNVPSTIALTLTLSRERERGLGVAGMVESGSF
jgi:hypothetical protein